MKITKVAKKARSLSEKSLYECDIDSAEAYEHCADMLEETILEIREELANMEQDYKNIEIGQISCEKAMSSAMIVVLKWALDEEDKK